MWVCTMPMYMLRSDRRAASVMVVDMRMGGWIGGGVIRQVCNVGGMDGRKRVHRKL